MASDCSTSTSSASIVPKSKQERIRDNQRRSRARRQEYLSDLERRLKECHATCREAELQRTAFADLQVENARLRDLLNYAGVSPDIVEGFGRQRISTHLGHAATAVPRQIKPKFRPHVPSDQSNNLIAMRRGSTPGSSCAVASAPSKLRVSAPVIPSNSPGMYGSQHSLPFTATPTADMMNLSSTTGVSPASSYEWVLRSHGRPSVEAQFCCDAFPVPPQGPLLTDDGNQYNPTPTEMEDLKTRLAMGFSPPRSSESACRVNSQPMFHMMQEMNSNESYT